MAYGRHHCSPTMLITPKKSVFIFNEKYEYNCGDCTAKQKMLTDHAACQLYLFTSPIGVKKHHTHQGVMLLFFFYHQDAKWCGGKQHTS